MIAESRLLHYICRRLKHLNRHTPDTIGIGYAHGQIAELEAVRDFIKAELERRHADHVRVRAIARLRERMEIIRLARSAYRQVVARDRRGAMGYLQKIVGEAKP